MFGLRCFEIYAVTSSTWQALDSGAFSHNKKKCDLVSLSFFLLFTTSPFSDIQHTQLSVVLVCFFPLYQGNGCWTDPLLHNVHLNLLSLCLAHTYTHPNHLLSKIKGLEDCLIPNSIVLPICWTVAHRSFSCSVPLANRQHTPLLL